MELIFRPKRFDPKISVAVNKLANSPEHNLLYYDSFSWEKVYANFLDGSGIMALRKDMSWKVLGQPLAAPEERISVLFALLEHIFTRKLGNKLSLVTNERHRFLDLEKHTDFFKVGPVLEEINYPVFSFESWNGDQSSVRKAHHELSSLKGLKSADASQFSSAQLKKLVLEWRSGKGEYSHIFKMIDSGFEGVKTRVLSLDSQPVSLVAWWEVSGEAIIGLDISQGIPHEAILLDSILYLKEKRARKIVMISNDHEDLDIKNKLHPTEIRKAELFSLLDLE